MECHPVEAPAAGGVEESTPGDKIGCHQPLLRGSEEGAWGRGRLSKFLGPRLASRASSFGAFDVDRHGLGVEITWPKLRKLLELSVTNELIQVLQEYGVSDVIISVTDNLSSMVHLGASFIVGQGGAMPKLIDLYHRKQTLHTSELEAALDKMALQESDMQDSGGWSDRSVNEMILRSLAQQLQSCGLPVPANLHEESLHEATRLTEAALIAHALSQAAECGMILPATAADATTMHEVLQVVEKSICSEVIGRYRAVREALAFPVHEPFFEAEDACSSADAPEPPRRGPDTLLEDCLEHLNTNRLASEVLCTLFNIYDGAQFGEDQRDLLGVAACAASPCNTNRAIDSIQEDSTSPSHKSFSSSKHGDSWRVPSRWHSAAGASSGSRSRSLSLGLDEDNLFSAAVNNFYGQRSSLDPTDGMPGTSACIAAERALAHQECRDELRERPSVSGRGPDVKKNPLNPLYSMYCPHESVQSDFDNTDFFCDSSFYNGEGHQDEEEEEAVSLSRSARIRAELLESVTEGVIKPGMSGMRRSLVYGGRMVEKAAEIMSLRKEEQSEAEKRKDRATSSGWDATLPALRHPSSEEECNRVERASAASNLAEANSLLTSMDIMMDSLLQARNSPLFTAKQKASPGPRRMEECGVWQECLRELQSSAQRLITFIF
eukprot:gene9644-11427_t